MSASSPSVAGAKTAESSDEFEWLYGSRAQTTTDPANEQPADPDESANEQPAEAAPLDATSEAQLASPPVVSSSSNDTQRPSPDANPASTAQESEPDAEQGDAPDDISTASTETAPRPKPAAVIIAKTIASRLMAPALLALAFAAWMAVGAPMPGSSPDSNPEAGTARNAMADPVTSQALNDQKAAERYLAKHGNLNGFKVHGKGVRFAAAGSTFVASRLVDGVCYAYAWEGAGQNKPVQDATGAACTDEQVSQAQLVLDEQSIALAEAADTQATAAFSAASATASQFAINNWVQGAPSLTGLGADLGSGVRVVQNAGSWLVAQYGQGTACRQASITADAQVGDIAPCP